jgi:hypothetical protein
MRDDDARPEDQLPERPRSGGTLTDGRLPPEPVRPPRPPLPPERTTVSAPLITADDSAEGSQLFSDGDNADESDESDESDGSDGSDFLEGETVAENLSLPMANDPTRVTMVPGLEDTGLAVDKTVVAVVDFAALNRDRITVPPTAHDDDDDDDDDDREDFDAPTMVSTEHVDATAGASFFERGTDAGEEPQARGEPTAIAEITVPGGPPQRPIWFIGAVSFGVVSLLVVTVVVAYACSG